ncbi:hypothetical protein AAC387_Pa01g2739 [Persea americana]
MHQWNGTRPSFSHSVSSPLAFLSSLPGLDMCFVSLTYNTLVGDCFNIPIRLLSPPTLAPTTSNRIYNALALLKEIFKYNLYFHFFRFQLLLQYAIAHALEG